jgi:hypothetical protein
MKYFENFPRIITTQPNGTSALSLNLMRRVNIVPSMLNNPSLYYKYTMQDGDLPEIIANRYYDNPYRYWIFLFGNQTIDPQWDLGLSTIDFQNYLIDKYTEESGQSGISVVSWTQSEIKYYRKLVTTFDSYTNTTTTSAFNVDYDTYVSLPQNLVTTKTFPADPISGIVSTVTVTISKDTISVYDYEDQLNESKKQVNIVNKNYTEDIENKLKSLLSQ